MPCPLNLPQCNGGTRGARNPCPLREQNCPINTDRFANPHIEHELDNLRQTALTTAEAIAEQDPELARQIQQRVRDASQLQNEISEKRD